MVQFSPETGFLLQVSCHFSIKYPIMSQFYSTPPFAYGIVIYMSYLPLDVSMYSYIYIYYIFICFHYRLYTNVYVTIFICIHVCVCVHPPSCVSLSNSASYNMSIQIYAVMYVSTTLFMKSCVFFHLWKCTNLLTYYSMYISILFQTIFGFFNKCNDSV